MRWEFYNKLFQSFVILPRPSPTANGCEGGRWPPLRPIGGNGHEMNYPVLDAFEVSVGGSDSIYILDDTPNDIGTNLILRDCASPSSWWPPYQNHAGGRQDPLSSPNPIAGTASTTDTLLCLTR